MVSYQNAQDGFFWSFDNFSKFLLEEMYGKQEN